MLLLLLFFIFVFVPILQRGKMGAIFIKIIYSVMLLTGILSVGTQKKHFIVLSILAVIALFANWLTEIEPGTPMLIAHDIGAIAFNVFFALALLKKTFGPGEITYHRIVGSIVVYLLMGLIFTYVFHAIYLYQGPSSFNNIIGTGLREFVYFSFTSLSTMGYGDITPVHPLARSLANFEALLGQLYPAILIARLVSMEFEAATHKRDSNQ